MNNTTYHLRYLPLFYEDLEEKLLYISEVLHNKVAAYDLLNEVNKAILKRQPLSESFEPYHSQKERDTTYYRIYVKNFVIYYVVLTDEKGNKIMEVRRFLYSKQEKNYLL